MVLNRKNMIIILIICLILVFICMYRDNKYSFKKETTVEVSGTPVSSHTVILDAGHGEPDRSELYRAVEFQSRK